MGKTLSTFTFTTVLQPKKIRPWPGSRYPPSKILISNETFLKPPYSSKLSPRRPTDHAVQHARILGGYAAHIARNRKGMDIPRIDHSHQLLPACVRPCPIYTARSSGPYLPSSSHRTLVPARFPGAASQSARAEVCHVVESAPSATVAAHTWGTRST